MVYEVEVGSGIGMQAGRLRIKNLEDCMSERSTFSIRSHEIRSARALGLLSSRWCLAAPGQGHCRLLSQIWHLLGFLRRNWGSTGQWRAPSHVVTDPRKWQAAVVGVLGEARKAKHFLSQTTGIAFQERIRSLEHVAMLMKATKEKPRQTCWALRKALIVVARGHPGC